MSTTEKMYHCRTCERRTVHLEEKPARVIHFVLGLLTAGLWWLFWLFGEGLGPDAADATCTECGTAREPPTIEMDCRSCGAAVAKGTETCPHCGADGPTSWP